MALTPRRKVTNNLYTNVHRPADAHLEEKLPPPPPSSSLGSMTPKSSSRQLFFDIVSGLHLLPEEAKTLRGAINRNEDVIKVRRCL
jgi:hypothetical protein